MAKYNAKREPVVKETTTHQGGQGFTQRPEAELVGLLSTGIQNTFYEKEGEREARLKTLVDTIAKNDKEFVAKALIYARTVFGQRTVTHLGAVNLLPHLKGEEFAKRFFSKRDRKLNKGGVVYRIDDMAEILACYIAKNKIDTNGKWTMPRAMKIGFKLAIENSDAYELAKYQLKGNNVSLIDIVNMVHPAETERNGTVEVSRQDYIKATKGSKWSNQPIPEGDTISISTLRALVLGLLKQFNTVEDKNSEAGKQVAEMVKTGELSTAEAQKVLTEKKADNFEELIKTKKIGYLALLRNLRNIIKTNDESLLTQACELLVNQAFIKKSLVWPHQIDLAIEVMLIEFSGRQLQKVASALSTAYELSIPNLNNLLPEGRTAIVFDTSGSMESGGKVSMPNGTSQVRINSSPAQKAALIAATFAKGIGGDVYHFGTTCKRITGFNPTDSVNTLKKNFESHNGECGHGTCYHEILPELSRSGGKYDRVVIITDEQGADSFERSYNEYSKKYGTPYVYFINICGYGPTMAKAGNRVFRLYGYSADIYEKIPQLEVNINEVIDAIKRIEI